MKNLFSPDGFLWRALNVLTDIFALSLLWLVCCLPLVTIGPATTALYDAVVRCIRYQESGPYLRFFRTLRADLAVSIGSTVLWGLVIGLGLVALSMLRTLGETSRSAAIASAVYYVVLLLPCGAACWVFPILSRFTYGFKDLNLAALRLSVGFLPRTVILVLLTAELISICIRFLFPSFFLPACMMLLWSLFIESAFTKLGGGLKKDSSLPEDSDVSADGTS